MQRMSIAINDDLHEWLRLRAFTERRSMNQIVNEALEAYKEREEKEDKKNE